MKGDKNRVIRKTTDPVSNKGEKRKSKAAFIVFCSILVLCPILVSAAIVDKMLLSGSEGKESCRKIYGDGYAMGTDPEPVVIATVCANTGETSDYFVPDYMPNNLGMEYTVHRDWDERFELHAYDKASGRRELSIEEVKSSDTLSSCQEDYHCEKFITDKGITVHANISTNNGQEVISTLWWRIEDMHFEAYNDGRRLGKTEWIKIIDSLEKKPAPITLTY